MNRMNYFDPRTGALLAQPVARGIPLGPVPMRSRRRGFGDIPNSSGGPGPLVDPYTEADGVFNSGGGGGSAAATTSQSTAATPNPSVTGYMPASNPYGESDRSWTNPSTFATVPINAQTNTQVPVLSQNYRRNALIIQNGSTATGTDVAPTLYIGFNAQPLVGSALALAPGQGIAWDIITPRDSIYIAFGPFVNTGSSVKIQGAVVTSTFSP